MGSRKSIAVAPPKPGRGTDCPREVTLVSKAARATSDKVFSCLRSRFLVESIRNDYNHLCGATIGDRAIRNAGARFVVQMANRRHIHVLGYRIKRGAGQVEITE